MSGQGLKAVSASGTGQRKFWSTGSYFTSAPEQLNEQVTLPLHLTAFTSHPVPVLTALQGSSSHTRPQGWYQAHVLISNSRERENQSDPLPGQVTSQG